MKRWVFFVLISSSQIFTIFWSSLQLKNWGNLLAGKVRIVAPLGNDPNGTPMVEVWPKRKHLPKFHLPVEPMPEKVDNFKSINLRFAYLCLIDYLKVIRLIRLHSLLYRLENSIKFNIIKIMSRQLGHLVSNLLVSSKCFISNNLIELNLAPMANV
jgi:hypothetical protein